MNQNEMNVLFLLWARVGGALYSFEIAKELSKKEEVDLHLSISNQNEILEDFKILNVPGLYVDTYNSAAEFIDKWVFRRKQYEKQLRDYLIEQNIDLLIIGMDFFWGSVFYKAAQSAGVKTIYVVHEPKPHPKEPFMMGMIMRWTLKTLITGADHLVALTGHVKNYLKDQYNIEDSNISVIPHGVFSFHEAVEPKKLPENDPVKLLFFGAIKYYKGLDILLKAYRLLEEKFDSIQLEIWGSGDISEYQDLIDNIDKIRIENRWISEEEIKEIFRESHICVLPYRDASQSGIAGIASSAGMPIVACPAEGLKEQLKGSSALFADDFSPESLAEAIEKLITKPEYYSDQSKNILNYTDQLSWSSIASRFVNIGKQLVSKNNP